MAHTAKSPLNLPDDLRRLIGAARWQENEIGHSNTTVYRLERRKDALYLKVATGFDGFELREETARLRWLRGRLPVAEILYAGEAEDRTWLLMTEVPGQIAIDRTLDLSPADITRLLAEGMKMIHSLDIRDCPFDHRLERRVALAQARMTQGLIDPAEFDAERQGHMTDRVYARLLATRPDSEDLVFTHGDYCLPNILMDSYYPAITGFIDLGRAGVADRHQDIALCVRSLIYNFGAQWVPLLYNTYGRDHIDPAKIEYYKLLDEFF
jgi:aminoglycoside phosphotransferase